MLICDESSTNGDRKQPQTNAIRAFGVDSRGSMLHEVSDNMCTYTPFAPLGLEFGRGRVSGHLSPLWGLDIQNIGLFP